MDHLFFTTRSSIRDVIVCGLLTIGLAACGGGSDGSSSGSGAAVSSLVSPTGGTIDRTDSSGSTTTPPAADTTTPVTSPTNPPAASTGTATLDWTPPTQNVDGSTLADLAGYTVYYGTTPGDLSQSIKVANPGLATYTVSNLSSGTWYFAVTAYSSSGTESTRSAVVSVTI